MHKSVINNSGQKVGTYYPITGKLVLVNGKPLKFDKVGFKEYCEEMGWSFL